MIHNERELFSKLEDLQLSETKRALMRSELAAFVDLHAINPRQEQERFNSIAFLGRIYGRSRRMMAASLVVLLVLITGTATTYASERAVPGELLYSVKVNVAEPVASVFAGEGAAQARHYAKIALRRVQEAEILESRGELNAEHAEELSTRFALSADRAEQEAMQLAASGDYSASLAVRTELAAELSEQVETLGDADPAPEAIGLVAATEPVDTAAIARSAKMAVAEDPVVASAPLELATGEVSALPLKQLIYRKIASLRVNTNPREDLHEKFAKDTEAEIASSDTRKVKQISAARTLLMGASVAQEEEATSTATSTTLDGTEIIKEILKAKKPQKKPVQEPNKSVEGDGQDAQSEEAEAEPSDADTSSSSGGQSLKDAINTVTNAVGAGSLLP